MTRQREGESIRSTCDTGGEAWEKDPLWGRLAKRSLPRPSNETKREVMAAARQAAMQRRASSREKAPKETLPWWLPFLQPGIASLLVFAACLAVAWVLRAGNSPHSNDLVVPAAKERVIVAAQRTDLQLLSEADRRFANAHSTVDRVFRDSEGPQIDRALKQVRNAAYVLRAKTVDEMLLEPAI